jgi:rod shape determining protein RodA
VRRFLDFDWLLFLSALFLFGMGLLSLYSLSPVGEWSWSGNFFLRQAIFGLLGIVVMFFVSTIDYRHIGRFSTSLYFLALGALLLVVLFGRTVRGTSGWIEFGTFQFQPVEGAKIALIIFLASFIAKKGSELGEWVRIIASFILSAALVFLVLKQPDLGSALVLSFVWVGMILVSGIRFKHIAALVVFGALVVSSGWFLLEDYQRSRIEAFIDPESDPRGSGYNVLQSMIAVGSGGMFGKGLGYGSQSQLNFLPEKHTDFLVAVIAEELGLFGVGVVLFAYGLLLYRIRRIAGYARDNTGYLICIGASAYFFFQILVNVGMNLGALPVTGLPAPFLSYGGSSLLASFIVVGLVLSVHHRRRREYLLPSGTFPGEDGFSREISGMSVPR